MLVSKVAALFSLAARKAVRVGDGMVVVGECTDFGLGAIMIANVVLT